MASYPKPGVLARFRKGVLISVIEGVVATLNWLVSFADHFSVGPGLTLSGESAGKPHLALNLVAGDNVSIDEDGDAVKISATGGSSSTGVTIVGSDGSECSGVQQLTILSGANTTIETSVVADSEDATKATLRIDVYYS